MTVRVTKAETHLARPARAQTVCPRSPRLCLIVRMQQRALRVPCDARVGPEPKRMMLRQSEKIRTSLVDEDELARKPGVPRVRRNHVQRGLQLRFKRVVVDFDSEHWLSIAAAGEQGRRFAFVLPDAKPHSRRILGE